MRTARLSALSILQKTTRITARLAAISAGLGFIGQAAAQGFPTKPIEMTVLFGG